jgi:cardiolipin synthase
MKASGVHLQMYHPLRWYTLSRMNNRTHRKILVVDGKTGFTGGVGIADPWLGHAQDPNHWRDTHFRVDGPAVGELQAAFMDNWLKTEGEVLHGDEYFPEVPPSGDALAQVFTSSAGGGGESARLMYLMSIASAKQSVRIAAAYFVPDDLSVETLLAARKRGVNIEIILPGDQIDARVVRKASRARWGALLRAGVAIYEYVPTMYHCKVMIVDGLWVAVGSTNFDTRSFRLNDEANLNVFDEAFARAQVANFEADRDKARRVSLQMWQDRPWTEKVAEHAAALFRSQL